MDFQKKLKFLFCLISEIDSILSNWIGKHTKNIQLKTRVKETSLLDISAENTFLILNHWKF